MKILLHSSKTMKPVHAAQSALTTPHFFDEARALQVELAKLSVKEIAALMKISEKLAETVRAQIGNWPQNKKLSPAALTFRGDIYSGLRAQDWDKATRQYAAEHLWILSGLYGILRPFDGIAPYRLEMGYKIRIAEQSLYEYWNKNLAAWVRAEDVYINITADEYLRAIKKSLGSARVISPKFLTVSPKTGQPVFVTVHAKIARGAFANWLITQQLQDVSRLHEFNDLGYVFDKTRSTHNMPVFVCNVFGGIGLSTRLT